MSKYALSLIAKELVSVKSMGFDKNSCGGCTHGLPCVCQLTSLGVGSMPLKSVHVL